MIRVRFGVSGAYLWLVANPGWGGGVTLSILPSTEIIRIICPFIAYARHQCQLSLLPSVGREMSTSQEV